MTEEHPLFVAGEGWVAAGEVEPGAVLRSSDLDALTVLGVEVAEGTARVHNLEVAQAHTYFAGELEAWGHDRRIAL